MELMLHVRNQGDTPVLTCRGSIIRGNESEALHAALSQLLGAADRVIVNLQQVHKIDCAGLGVIAALAGQAETGRKSLELCAVSEPVRALLRLTCLDRVLKVHEQHSSAFACVGTAA